MNNMLKIKTSSRLSLAADTAKDLMTPNPISIRDTATIKEVVAFLSDRGISAAPVIDQGGRPVGVLSRTDVLVHDREKADYLEPVPEYYHKSDLTLGSGEVLPGGFQIEKADRTLVRDIMTPVIFAVAPETPARRVVEDMLSLKVHRLFVVDDDTLVGVISALDILKHLHG